jgi:carotenoid cleavage dioxygenase
LEVVGHIPHELNGVSSGSAPIRSMSSTLVRRCDITGFSGTGMAHGLRLRDGKADWFRSRFVLDRDAARVLSRKPIAGPSEGRRDGNVNTNLMNVGGTLCAVVEGGQHPRSNSTMSWQSVRRTDFRRHTRSRVQPVTQSSIRSRASTTLWRMNRFQPVRYISGRRRRARHDQGADRLAAHSR